MVFMTIFVMSFIVTKNSRLIFNLTEMKQKVKISLVQLANRRNIWYFEYAVLIGTGRRQKLVSASYPDWWEIYIKKLPIYNFYYN